MQISKMDGRVDGRDDGERRVEERVLGTVVCTGDGWEMQLQMRRIKAMRVRGEKVPEEVCRRRAGGGYIYVCQCRKGGGIQCAGDGDRDR